MNLIETTSKAMQSLEGDEWESITYTPYGIARLINQILTDLGSDLSVRPQMMYNYDRNGLIVKGKRNVKAYTAEEAAAFAVRYVNKKLS